MKPDGLHAKRQLTEDEKKIVVTVIQWLGSHVGQKFYQNVIAESCKYDYEKDC